MSVSVEEFDPRFVVVRTKLLVPAPRAGMVVSGNAYVTAHCGPVTGTGFTVTTPRHFTVRLWLSRNPKDLCESDNPLAGAPSANSGD